MGIENRWDKTHRVEMLPVTHKETYTSGGEVNAEENLSFWEATPAGKIDLTFGIHQPSDFKPGDYYYIDFEENPEGRWKLSRVSRFHNSMEVVLEAPWGGDYVMYGSIKMTIDNEVTWKHFEDHMGKKWGVAFTWAEKSDFG